ATVGDEGGHAADGVRPALVARAYEEFRVGTHEGHGHGDGVAVRQDPVAAARAVLLDDAEDEVPAPGVEARAVVAQLVQDLFHLEGSGERLDQYGGADGAARNAQRVLREIEHVVPEARLQVAFHLRQVEVRALALRDLPLCAVEEVQTEVEET